MAHPLRVQRKRTKGYRLPPGTVVVTRPTKWGNPFQVVRDGVNFAVADHGNKIRLNGYTTRRDAAAGAVRLFRAYLDNDGSQPGTIRDEGGVFLKQLAVEELRGKRLACYCSLSDPCHADVLCELANQD